MILKKALRRVLLSLLNKFYYEKVLYKRAKNKEVACYLKKIKIF